MTVDNFVGSLVEMAKAHERLPQIEAELAEARNQINSHLNTIQRLETKLMERSNEISMHLAHIRELEVSRDDAQFHALEADDRTQRALDFIKATFGNAGALIQALEPPAMPAPQPVDAPAVAADGGLATPDVGEREHPLPASVEQSTPPTDTSSGTFETASHTSQAPMVDHSGASPAPEVAAQPGEPIAASAPTVPVMSSGEAAFGASTAEVSSNDADAPTVDPSTKPTGPYTGKTYSEVYRYERDMNGESNWWCSQDHWLEGGGTIDNYYA